MVKFKKTYIISCLILFIISFLISYAITDKYIQQKQAEQELIVE